MARRGRIILLLADGVTIIDVAATVGMSRKNIYKWVKRFLQQRVEGLTDKPKGRYPRKPPRPDLSDQNDVDIVF
jgi:transposase